MRFVERLVNVPKSRFTPARRLKLNLQPYIRRYTSSTENFENSYDELKPLITSNYMIFR